MTTASRRIGLGLALCLALGACALPRGAAFESEVVHASGSSEEGQPASFAVLPVTSDALPLYAAWPRPDEGLGWLASQGRSAGQVIAPGDILAVTVWNTEENSLLTGPGQRQIALPAITVAPSGRIFMPYVGEVEVAGLSPDRAREALEAQILRITPSAQVQLEVADPRGSLVSLVGGVAAPGAYPLRDGSFTVLSLIAQGGGVSAGLNNPQIRLVRGGAIYGTSIDRLFEDPALDSTLRAGDKLIVEPDERFFLSLGAAGTEAVHPFPRDEISALEALSIIGGVADNRANPQGILLLRNYPAALVRSDGSGAPNTRVIFVLDLTSADGLFSARQFPIQSGDLVYATESRLTTTQTVFGLVGSAFGLARQVGGGVIADLRPSQPAQAGPPRPGLRP